MLSRCRPELLPDVGADKPESGNGLSVLACNLTRVMNIIGIRPLMAAVRASWGGSAPDSDPGSAHNPLRGALPLTISAGRQENLQNAPLKRQWARATPKHSLRSGTSLLWYVLDAESTLRKHAAQASASDAVDGSSAGIAMCQVAVFWEPPKRSHPWNRLAR